MQHKISVTIAWQDNIIFHKKTSKFIIGQEAFIPIEKINVDFIIPDNKLKHEYWVLLDNNTIYIPEGVMALCNNQIIKDKEVDIRLFKRVELQFGNIRILVQFYKEEFIATKFDLNDMLSNKVFILLSAVFHIMLMISFAYFVPPLGITDAEASEKDQMFLMQQYLKASAEREKEAREDPTVTEDAKQSTEGGTGTRAKGDEGSMGNPNSRDMNKRFSIQGPVNNKDIRIARDAALREARDFGMIGLLNVGSGGDPNAPTAIWGRDDSLGNDPFSARGNMWGDAAGDAYGAGGLGLSGIGEGGGGRGEGIGLGSLGTIGHGAGLGNGQGFGNGFGRLSGGHTTKVPQVRMGSTVVTGRIPPEVIQRIVRQNYGRFRICYETGLKNNPNLQGRVAVRFVIGRDGSVSNVSNGGSDIPDQAVTQCVVRAFYGLSFPSPDGVVTVIYPIMFSPQ